MAQKIFQGRWGSSGGHSWQSEDTITDGQGANRSQLSRLTSEDRQRYLEDEELSPRSRPSSRSPHPGASFHQNSEIAPWDQEPTNGHQEHGSNLTEVRSVEDFPEPQWASMSAGSNGGMSPSFPTLMHPGKESDGVGGRDSEDGRHPSTTSADTDSSQKTQRANAKSRDKMAAIFGASPDDLARRSSSNLQIPTPRTPNSRHENQTPGARRQGSWNGGKSPPASPDSSRPRTPPSSDVTPWAYQDHQHISSYGDAPVQQDFTGPDRERYARQSTFPLRKQSTLHDKVSNLAHRRHRTTKSNEKSQGDGYDEPRSIARSETQPASRSNDMRHISSTSTGSRPGSSSDLDGNGNERPEQREKKRSILDKIRGKNKGDKADGQSTGPGSGSSNISLPLSSKGRTPSARSPSSARDPTNSPSEHELSRAPTNASTRASVSQGSQPRKDHRPHMFRSNRRGTSNDLSTSIPPQATGSQQATPLWDLNTDLSDMTGIVANQPKVTTPNAAPRKNNPFQDLGADYQDGPETPGLWEVPDSWAVKRQVVEDNVKELQGIDEEPSREEEPGLLFGIRVFRSDNTFMTMNMRLSATSAEIIQMFAKKAMLQDDIDNYHIILKKHNTARQLEPGDKPIKIQRHMLELAGYRVQDHLEGIGREDHSYLCRFVILHTSSLGHASVEKDSALQVNKKGSVDLSGKNLVTMPLALYHKAAEISALDISRNISIDVPKDFIQACAGLKEIRFTSNEASRLPPSLNLATRLHILDVSNNRLEQLDHAQLHRLENLLCLNLANNRLNSTPGSFADFRCMRVLDISSNSLTSVPESILQISSLTNLNLNFNQITSLSNIGCLQNLEALLVTNNKLSGRLDDSMSNLKRLHDLDLRFNEVDNIDVCSSLPALEVLAVGHNLITSFEGSLPKIVDFFLDHNPVTKFSLQAASPSINKLDLASAKLAHLPDDLFGLVSTLLELNLNKNHFVAISPQIGKLQNLQVLKLAKNSLDSLPPEFGRLQALRELDVRENNLSSIPGELWWCRCLTSLNASCNVLRSFPKIPDKVPAIADLSSMAATSNQPTSTPASTSPSNPLSMVNSVSSTTNLNGDLDAEERDTLGDIGSLRRGSAVSSNLSSDGSHGSQTRKNSIASLMNHQIAQGRKPSQLSRSSTETTLSPMARKDSVAFNKTTMTFAGSLRSLSLAENRLTEDVLDQIGFLPELRILNLSYNDLDDIPTSAVRRLKNLQELHLAQNQLSSLPSEDLEALSNLQVLFLNGNRFQVLPGELAKLARLSVLDVSSNSLKYNVYNYPYDWNWNSNPQLRYLSLSGNKRLEIKPPHSHMAARESQRLTDFTSLNRLRVLGLMDVTIMTDAIPDNTENRRVRTAGSSIGSMPYGMADTLGEYDHVSTMDLIVPRLEGHEDETLFGLFDMVPRYNHEGKVMQPTGGSKVVKYLQDKFEAKLKDELHEAKRGNDDNGDAALDALRRTYLALNKDLATEAQKPPEAKAVKKQDPKAPPSPQPLTPEDLNHGCVATVMYLHGIKLHVSNVGDAQCMLIRSDSEFRFITDKHDPASGPERKRIREAGGFVSRQGKLNDRMPVSRAFGFPDLMPSVIAAPSLSKVEIQDEDEMILIASRELWDYLTPDFVVDCARSERGDLMRAAQKLRDLAIAYGAKGKITVMLVGVAELQKKEKARYRSHSLSLGPSGLQDEYMSTTTRRPKRGRDATLDSKLARLDQEVDAPTGDVTLVFTDIKSSTQLWETFPTAMRSGIKQHNEVLRRQLRLIGGYEVKTEGDAFMVAFPSVTSALLWAFAVQLQLLETPWPQEILHSMIGEEVKDNEGNLLFRGLSVRMGIHWGQPVCETDPVTRRMDYFGPMVNRAARISGVADGGEITVSSDFIGEIQRLLESHIESDRSSSVGSEEQANFEMLSAQTQRELRSLSSHGFEVKDLGEKRLKGLENPEYVYLMYPHVLAGRLPVKEQRAAAEKAAESASRTNNLNLSVDLDSVWDLWSVSLRLEMLCSTLENPGSHQLKPPETALLEMTKERGDVITDKFLKNFVEHQVSRIETCITSLTLRNMMRPFRDGMLDHACAMTDIFADLTSQLQELKAFKEQNDIEMAPS